MNPIPNPILKKLVLTLLVGTGCFIVGLVFFLCRHDHIFFLLSCAIFLLSMGKGISLFHLARKNSYTVIEGLCISAERMPFQKSSSISLSRSDGEELHLRIDKEYHLQPGLSYRFYFKDSGTISDTSNPLLQKALLTDNLLGIEKISIT